MYYSVCIPAVFSGVPIHEPLETIRNMGYEACEIWTWWDKDMDAFEAALKKTGLRLAALCTKFIPLNDPAARSQYLEGLRETIAVAKRLNCPTIISQIGQEIAGVSREDQHASIVEGLKACAPILEEAGLTLVAEPLNTYVDHKGYYLYTSKEGFEIIREVNSPNVRLLFDIYHQQIMEGNLISNIVPNVDLIGHFHAAAVPGRGSLTGENEINYASVLAAIARTGYNKAIGLEYVPKTDPEQSLKDILSQLPLN